MTTLSDALKAVGDFAPNGTHRMVQVVALNSLVTLYASRLERAQLPPTDSGAKLAAMLATENALKAIVALLADSNRADIFPTSGTLDKATDDAFTDTISGLMCSINGGSGKLDSFEIARLLRDLPLLLGLSSDEAAQALVATAKRIGEKWDSQK